MASLEQQVAELKRKIDNITGVQPIVGQGIRVQHTNRGVTVGFSGAASVGGTNFKINVVTVLPDIPSSPTIVWFREGENPAASDQLWATGPGNTKWVPLMYLTTTSGAPPP